MTTRRKWAGGLAVGDEVVLVPKWKSYRVAAVEHGRSALCDWCGASISECERARERIRLGFGCCVNCADADDHKSFAVVVYCDPLIPTPGDAAFHFVRRHVSSDHVKVSDQGGAS